MKTYGVYLVKNRTKSVLCNYNEFFIIPTITIVVAVADMTPSTAN